MSGPCAVLSSIDRFSLTCCILYPSLGLLKAICKTILLTFVLVSELLLTIDTYIPPGFKNPGLPLMKSKKSRPLSPGCWF